MQAATFKEMCTNVCYFIEVHKELREINIWLE